MNEWTLLALLPEWIFGGAVLLFIYKAPKLWLKLGEIGGWIVFLGAPVLAEIVTELIDEMVGLRSAGLGRDVTVTYFAVIFAGLGFSSIASSKLILWASGAEPTSSGLWKDLTKERSFHADPVESSQVGDGFDGVRDWKARQ